MKLDHKERTYMTAITFFLLFAGLAAADFLAAVTVVYSMGPSIGMKAEYVFLDPEGGVFSNFTWFGLGLVVSVALTLVALCYCLVCSLSFKAERKKVEGMNEKLKDAKSAILEVCPMELWYSGEA